jgi:hypothetical protein
VTPGLDDDFADDLLKLVREEGDVSGDNDANPTLVDD